MSIRIRLLLSYLAMLIIPLLLLMVSFVAIAGSVMGDLRTVFQLDTGHKNPIAAIIGEEADVAADIRLRIASDPDSLRDAALLQSYADRLKKINMGLIAREDERILYASSALAESDVAAHLPPVGETLKSARDGDRDWMAIRQYDAVFTNGAHGSYYVFLNVDFLGWFVEKFAKRLLTALLVILVIVNGILTFYMSRRIIKPLDSLKRAAGELKEGNLNYAVRPEARDEIGELAVAFEEMRVKLKDLIERQLQYEDNRKSLISNISHDLKSPVAAIRGYVEGILDGVTDSPEKLDRYVRTIHAKTVQMDRLIDELFLFAKLDVGRVPFHFELVDLNAFLGDCAEELQVDAEKRGIRLDYDSSVAGPAWIAGDREKLKRVFVNIVENAMKYMDKPEGRIWLELKDEGDRWLAAVKDNGQGISAEALPHIFERFYRADPARNVDTGGSGLGLSIARHIVEAHGGTIQAASEPGVGTVILIAIGKRTDGGLGA